MVLVQHRLDNVNRQNPAVSDWKDGGARDSIIPYILSDFHGLGARCTQPNLFYKIVWNFLVIGKQLVESYEEITSQFYQVKCYFPRHFAFYI